MSAAAGVKYSARISMNSTTASTSHIREAPQNMNTSMMTFNFLAFSLEYQMSVVTTAAKIVISNVMTVPPLLPQTLRVSQEHSIQSRFRPRQV